MKAPLDGGMATTLVSELAECLTVDATNVYWTNSGCSGGFDQETVCGIGSVMWVPVDGGTPATLASSELGPVAVAVDSANVYWTGYKACAPYLQACIGGTGVVMKLALDGGTPTTLAAGLDQPQGLVVDTVSAYWTDVGAGTVMKVPLGGGTPTTLAVRQGYPNGIAVDSASVYWTDWPSTKTDSFGTVMKGAK
jgi:hypothetical protein